MLMNDNSLVSVIIEEDDDVLQELARLAKVDYILMRKT